MSLIHQPQFLARQARALGAVAAGAVMNSVLVVAGLAGLLVSIVPNQPLALVVSAVLSFVHDVSIVGFGLALMSLAGQVLRLVLCSGLRVLRRSGWGRVAGLVIAGALGVIIGAVPISILVILSALAIVVAGRPRDLAISAVLSFVHDVSIVGFVLIVINVGYILMLVLDIGVRGLSGSDRHDAARLVIARVPRFVRALLNLRVTIVVGRGALMLVAVGILRTVLRLVGVRLTAVVSFMLTTGTMVGVVFFAAPTRT